MITQLASPVEAFSSRRMGDGATSVRDIAAADVNGALIDRCIAIVRDTAMRPLASAGEQDPVAPLQELVAPLRALADALPAR